MFITTIVSMSQNYILQNKLRQGMRYLLLTVMAAKKDVREPGVLNLKANQSHQHILVVGLLSMPYLTLKSCW